MARLEFLKIRLDVSEELDFASAALLAFLSMKHPKLKMDKWGFREISYEYVKEGIGMDRRMYQRKRLELEKAGYIGVAHGKNQNCKTKYKVLK